MHAADKLFEIHNAGLHVFADEVSARVGRRVAVERQIARLGANQDFVRLQFSRFDSLLDCGTDVALRALVTVIDRGIKNIYAGDQSRGNGLGVASVGHIIRLAEVGAESDGREPKLVNSWHVLRTTEVSGIV